MNYGERLLVTPASRVILEMTTSTTLNVDQALDQLKNQEGVGFLKVYSEPKYMAVNI